MASDEPTLDVARRVDDYAHSLFVGEDHALQGALDAAVEGGLPDIHVSPTQGRLLHVLVKAIGARRALELGTLAGYSAIEIARALPEDGQLITLELDPHHAEVARASFERAGVAERVEVRVGPAIDSLHALAEEGGEPFDFVFLDADKSGYPAYLDAILPMCKSGALIIADNVVRGGAVLEPQDDYSKGADEYNRKVAADDRLDGALAQLVGAKGYDGWTVARVR